MVTGAYANAGEVVGKPVSAILKFGIRNLTIAASHREALRKKINRMLEEIGKVQRHGIETRTCYCFGQAHGEAFYNEESPE